MSLSFRAKLTLIVGIALGAFASVLALGTWIGVVQTRALTEIEERMVPKLELGPKLEVEFEHLRKGMQDAVAAQDSASLDASIEVRNRLIALTTGGKSAIEPGVAASLRHAITSYHAAAYGVSRRLMRGETGEALVDAMADMQAQQRATEDLIQRAVRLERKELASGFGAVRGAIETGLRYRLVIGFVALTLVLSASIWVGRSTLRTLSDISNGVARFGTGDFSQPIAVDTSDEFGAVARDANQMAASLQKLSQLRDRNDHLRAGMSGLSDELRGDLDPDEVAARAITFLAKRTGAVAGCFYLMDEQGLLRTAGEYAGGALDPAWTGRTFHAGEGLVGQAALGDDLLVVRDPPVGYLKIRSGLGEAIPARLVLMRLARLGASVGVLELAFFGDSSDDVTELLLAARETMVIAINVARSRATLRRLLDESTQQAERLAQQEEELRASNRDLSLQQEELKRANHELELQRAALSQQNSELEEARERVQQKAEELARVSSYKSQFLANMSHELRTPLNSMLLLSHLLAENDGARLSAKQVEFARTIHGAGKDLLGLINQVLDLAKIESGKQELDIHPVVIVDVVENMRRLFAASALEKGLKLELQVAADVPHAMSSDRSRLDRILVNLLGNALKFTERGTVTLTVTRRASDESDGSGASFGVAFTVTDTGIGIPRDAQERIFAAFEQLETRTARRYGGTGLGLAIARESARLLGGELSLESREGRGSSFTLWLPEHTGTTSFEAAPPRQVAPGPPDDRAVLGVKDRYLLIVEDDPVVSEQLVSLTHAQHLKAVVTTNGADAIALVKRNAPLGIILDVKLPDIDGWTVMERLHHDPATRSIPVHFISGVDAPERALALGAIGYLTKPATRDELSSVVRSLARPVATGDAGVLVVEDDPAGAESVVALLRADGMRAEHVGSAAAALSALETASFACVVLDLGLPDMDGLGMLQTLKDRQDIGRPAVVVHTGRALTREETTRIEAYSQAVVLKDGSSAERLIDEVRLFVQHLNPDAPRRTFMTDLPLPDVSLTGSKILIADDDMRTVYALSALLRGKGAEVLVAETGREALDVLARESAIDCVLMDVMMPEMDGYEAMRRLRSGGFPKLPVIALTARAMRGERERCLEAGASDYLAKPVDPARLLSLLAQHLGLSKRSGVG
jgi:CheY-like chemotaxis protein/signal transduction histidine kinase